MNVCARARPAKVGTRVLCGWMLGQLLITEHVQQGRLPSVVKAEEEDLCVFLV